MQENIKIAHLTSMHDWNDDRIFQRACVGLARKNYEVHLVALKDNDSHDELNGLMGVHLHLLKIRSGWKRRWFSSKEVVIKAASLNCDLYQFHDPDILPHISILKKACPNAIIVYDIHENYASRFELWGLPAFIGGWYRSYENRIISSIDGYTVVSESMKKLFEDISTPVEITRNSADIQRLRSMDFSVEKIVEQPIVITSGSHSNARNCVQTVESIKTVRTLVSSPFQFQFVGRYIKGIEDEMLNQANEDGTNEFLKLAGMVPWEENFKRLKRAFCGCVFYADNPNNRVGIPNRLFEYMYCGLPVVVSDFSELKNVVDEAKCGLVVNSEDPEDIARGIAELLNNPEMASKMGENGKKAMETKFGYHVELERLEEFYKKLVNSKRA